MTEDGIHGGVGDLDPPPDKIKSTLARFPDEKALVPGLRAGDERALRAFAEVLSQRFVPVFTQRCGGQYHDAEEIVNTAALKAITNIDSYRPNRGQFWSWVFTIIENTRIDHYRAQERREPESRLELDADPDMEEVLFQAAPTLFQLDRPAEIISADVFALRRGLGQLSDRDRQLLELYYGFNVPDDQVAKEFNMNPDSVRKLRSRARKRLEDILRGFPEFQDRFDAHGGEASPAIPRPLRRRE